MHEDIQSPLLNKWEVSAMLKMSRSGVDKMIARNALIKPFKMGRNCLWLKKDIEKMLAERANAAKAQQHI